jgi:hypothetical protein
MVPSGLSRDCPGGATTTEQLQAAPPRGIASVGLVPAVQELGSYRQPRQWPRIAVMVFAAQDAQRRSFWRDGLSRISGVPIG